MDSKIYNTMMERINRTGTPSQKRKKYKTIVKELGARGITMKDISQDNFNGKSMGFLEMMGESGMTFDEVVVLQQYAKAIINQDTKAAEFLRDSVGDKPSSTVNMNVEEKSGLESMSLEELEQYKRLLEMNIAIVSDNEDCE